MSTTENVQEAAAAAAEKLAEAAAAATSDETSPGEDAAGELLGGEVDQWSFLTKAIVAVVVIVACLIANKVSCEIKRGVFVVLESLLVLLDGLKCSCVSFWRCCYVGGGVSFVEQQ